MCQTERHQISPLSANGQPRATRCRRVRSRRVRRWARRGVTAIEYCLLASLIGVISIGILQHFGAETRDLFNKVTSAIDGETGGDDDTGGGSGDVSDGGDKDGDVGGGNGEGKGKGGRGGAGKGKGKGGGNGKGGGKGKGGRGRSNAH